MLPATGAGCAVPSWSLLKDHCEWFFLDTVRSRGAENNGAYVNLIDATEMGSLKDSSSLVS